MLGFDPRGGFSIKPLPTKQLFFCSLVVSFHPPKKHSVAKVTDEELCFLRSPSRKFYRLTLNMENNYARRKEANTYPSKE